MIHNDILKKELVRAIDAFFSFAEELGPIKPADLGLPYGQFGPALSAAADSELEQLDCTLAICAARCGLQLPGRSRPEVGPNTTLFGFSELPIRHSNDIYIERWIFPDHHWRYRLLMLRALADCATHVVNQCESQPSEIEGALITQLPLPAGHHENYLKPRYDHGRRALYLDDKPIKTLHKHGSPNVLSVLEKFEEKGWPPSIEFPLDLDKRSDTIKSLNKGLCKIYFCGRGNVREIGWDFS